MEIFKVEQISKKADASKRKDLTLSEKISLIKHAAKTKCGQAELAKKFGVSQTQVCRLLKRRQSVLEDWESNVKASQKRKRPCPHAAVERALLAWVKKTCASNVLVNDAILKQKAEQLAEETGSESFKATNGWFCRWKQRSQIRFYANYVRDPQAEPDLQKATSKLRSSDALLLHQRLQQHSTPQIQIPMVSESLLQSQPLSPTKLKVTRQSNKPPQASTPKPAETPEVEAPEEVCLRWNSHHFNMQTSFPNLLQREQYVDVTLAAEGKTLKCHRLILSSCSAYFEEILNGITPLQHPVIFMKDIPFWILKSLCDFMYAGEVHIDQNKLEEMLHVAEALKIKGLAGKTNPPPPPAEEKVVEPAVPVKPPHAPEQQTQQQQPALVKQSRLSTQASSGIEVTTVDPLDLLQTSYLEESPSSSSTAKPNNKEMKFFIKKAPLRKLRKRRSSQHEMSPPPLFHLRKGTRSRPNVKIPKYYHSDYDDVTKKQDDSPPTASASGVAFPPVETVIKTEPIDVIENDIAYPNEPEQHAQFKSTLEMEENDQLISENQLIITPIESILQNGKAQTKTVGDPLADGNCNNPKDNFVKITLSSKYLKENEEIKIKLEQIESNQIKLNEKQLLEKELIDNRVENDKEIEAVNSEVMKANLESNKDVKKPAVVQPKRRGRKRKIRRGRSVVDAKSKAVSIQAKPPVNEQQPVDVDVEEADNADELSASLKRLESTEGLEVTTESVVETEVARLADTTVFEQLSSEPPPLVPISTPYNPQRTVNTNITDCNKATVNEPDPDPSKDVTVIDADATVTTLHQDNNADNVNLK